MTYIPAIEITETRERITAISLQITNIDTAITAINEIGSYRIDAGEGAQSVVYRKDIDNLIKSSQNLYRERQHLRQRLNGYGIVNVNLRL